MATALYRKYRPKCFETVIGQDHIVSTLKNQISLNRIGHAYLFCGSRGVGKTSLARIFSKAINCQSETSAPCGSCQTCIIYQNETNLDIIEIDAASNNGVDDARELREKIKYPPATGKYKVYIIDEVHSLSAAAFNALLKTLEEPPAHAVLILATTEPHKLPATILSRCMRFDFRLVSAVQLFDLICEIYKKEGKNFEDEAVRAIAAAAEGSVRDALSLADMCMQLGDGASDKLTLKKVNLALGASKEDALELLKTINLADIKGAIELSNQMLINGKSMAMIARELAILSRDLMVAKVAPSVLESTQETLAMYKTVAAGFDLPHLAALIVIFSETESGLRFSSSPRISFEIALIRAIKLHSADLSAIEQRLTRLEQAMGGGSVFAGGGAGGGGVSSLMTSGAAGSGVVGGSSGSQSNNLSAAAEAAGSGGGINGESSTGSIKSGQGNLTSATQPPQAATDKSTILSPAPSAKKSANSSAHYTVENSNSSAHYTVDSADSSAWPIGDNPNSSAHFVGDNSNLSARSTIDNKNSPARAIGDNSNLPAYSAKQDSDPSRSNTEENSQNNLSAIKLSARQLWGKIITYCRKNKISAALFQLIGRQDGAKAKIEGNSFVVKAQPDDYLAMCGDEVGEILRRAVVAEGCDYSIKIEKDTSDIDLEKEILGFYDEFGKGKVDVKGD
ncbi:MAG: DNA polymerase III subunit gamma/tau [Firmicutes bacterium]|nr:DNA polymerase III subunit gamma/tau [Bacillota bacterium]